MFRVAHNWTEKKTGTKWYEPFEGVQFASADERFEWLMRTGKNQTRPNHRDFMPLEEAEAKLKRFFPAE